MAKECTVLYYGNRRRIDEEMASFFSGKGWQIRWKQAASLAVCREYLKENPDIVISDHNLPDIDGLGVLRLVREGIHNIPFLFLGDFRDAETVIHFFRAGASDVILENDLTRLAEAVLQSLEDPPQNGRALHDEQEFWRTNKLMHMLTRGPAVIYFCRHTGMYEFNFVSENFWGVFGFSPEEYTRPDFWISRIHEADLARIKEGFVLLQKEGSCTCEYRFMGKDGKYRWIYDNMTLLFDDAGEPAEIIGFWIDVNDVKMMKKEISQKERQLSLITDNMRDMVSQVDRDGVFRYVSPSHEKVLGFRREDMIGRPVCEFIHPDHRDYVCEEADKAFSLRKGGSLEALCRKEDKDFTWLEVSFEPLVNGRDEMIGAVLSGRDITYQKETEKEIQQNLLHLKKVLNDTALTLAMAMEKRDPYTAGHQHRVSRLSCAIARELGLPDETVSGIQIASVLHDIGKISIPSEILSKPGALTDIEFSLLKTHSQIGHDILKNIEFPWPIAKIVNQHHERVNGTGYPQGLDDGSILMEARIIGLADTVEAMASHRPYRPALGIARAFEEIQDKRGVLYDANVVDACFRLHETGAFDFQTWTHTYEEN